MGFINRPNTGSSNPATKFLEWKSNEKCFSYYDKSKEENVLVDIPFKFLVMEEYHTVKGWNDKDEAGIYSNEVLFTNRDELTVKTFKGSTIAKGLYKDIRATVRDAGGKYHKSIYAMLENGELVNISIKGSAVSEWSDFIGKGAWKRLKDEWVCVEKAEKRKKGATVYHVPIFKFDTSLSDNDVEMAEEAATDLKTYMDQYMNNDKEDQTLESEVDKYQTETVDDLDF